MPVEALARVGRSPLLPFHRGGNLEELVQALSPHFEWGAGFVRLHASAGPGLGPRTAELEPGLTGSSIDLMMVK
jgi:hypothetical protein